MESQYAGSRAREGIGCTHRVPVDAVLLPGRGPVDGDGDGCEAGGQQAPQTTSVTILHTVSL